MLKRIAILLFPCILISCTPLTPDARIPSEVLPASMPKSYGLQKTDKETSSQLTASTKPWWQDFKRADLDTLIGVSLNANFDILTAWATLQKSEAIARKSTAGLFPYVGLDAGANRKQIGTQASSNAPETTNYADSFSLGVAASYEVDLWGRANSQRKADLLRSKASAEDLQSAGMSVAASVANTWASLLGNRAEFNVLQEQIAINEELVRLQTVRFNNGIGTSLTVLQQKELLASLKAQIPPLEETAILLRNELAVLQGTLPGSGIAFKEDDSLPSLEAIPETGLPIQLLENRPDVRAAWNRLLASDFDVSVAHANRFPSLKLSASYVFNSAQSSLLFNNWIGALVASLTAPLFDAGKLSSAEKQAKAEAEILVQKYAKTVATALQEVENALAKDKGTMETLHRLREQQVFAEAALIEARNSYLNGVVDFLNYITELENTQKLERSIVAQEVRVVQARIALYRSLGGLTFPDIEQYMLSPIRP